MTPRLLTLGTLSPADRLRVGRKAAALDELIRAGFDVPEGVVVPADSSPCADAVGLPAGFAEAVLARMAGGESDVQLAVRSSAPDEDGNETSKAGAYQSVLGVRGPDALRRAVRTCRGGQIPLIVQRQLEADMAGVAFSADPVTGNRDETIVEAVPGIGRAATDGSATPERWTVRESGATCDRPGHRVLDAEVVSAIAGIADAAEKLFGSPQDIEWACESEIVYIVQSRPTTALPVPPSTRIPPGTWLKEIDRYPEPMTEFGGSLASGAVADGLTSMFTYFGTLTDKIDCLTVGGEIYQRVGVVAPSPGRGRRSRPHPTSQWWILGLAARIDPTLRQRVRRSRRTASRAALAVDAASWEGEWRPSVQGRIDEYAGVHLADLSNRETAEHLQELVQWLKDCLRVHFRMIPAETIPLYLLAMTCHDLLGWPASRALALVAGGSASTSAPARALAPLAARVRDLPQVVAQLHDGADPATVLAAADPGLAADFAQWRRVYGASCISDDPGSPTVAEQPGLLIDLLTENHPTTAPAWIRGDALADARRELRFRRARTVRRFDRCLSDALGTYWLREDVAFWTSSVPGGLVRRACIDAGRRFAAEDRINRADDVVNLRCERVVTALLDDGVDLRADVRRSRAERAWTRAHPGPLRYGPAPAAIPNLRGLPRTARILNSALIWMRQSTETHATEDFAAGAGSTDTSGSPGRYTGRACVVRNAADLAKLRRGDVLICPTTDPAWSVAFGMVGGLVTDRGGTLSHAAIVAREFGVPAAVGVAGATENFADGDIVTVDGSAGTVRRTETLTAVPPAGRH